MKPKNNGLLRKKNTKGGDSRAKRNKDGKDWNRLEMMILKIYPILSKYTNSDVAPLSDWYTVQHCLTFVEQQVLNEVATCWIVIQLLLGNNSIFWNWRTMKCYRSVQKRKTEKFELEMVIKNKIAFRTFTVHLHSTKLCS